MATCPSCNALLKDGDWTCGACGAPVAGAGMAAAPGAGDYHAAYAGAAEAPAGSGGYGAPPSQPDYLPEYSTPSTTAAPAKAGSSGTLRLVLILAVVAIIAVVAVWFFALRGPSTTGDEFVGTWTATTQTGIATAVIAKNEDAFSVTLSGSQQGQKVTVPAHLDGKDLVITLDDFSQMAGEANADQLKDALKALAGDFRMVFSSVDAANVSLRIVGTAPSGQDYDQTFPMAKGAAAGT
jgi:hypothetical protein